jgi:arginine-tRNA-protein transferase
MQDAAIKLFQTPEHACGYWPERVARDVLLDPNDPGIGAAYSQMLAVGFRRSGGHVYRPRCPACRACVPMRLKVAAFAPNRSQRRCLTRNSGVELVDLPPRRSTERYALYRRYLASRHTGGGMEAGGPDEFDAFLTSEWSPTRFFELREGNRLLAVAVTDVLADALSAVYTFYDPDRALAPRGLGSLAILRQIEWAQRHARDYLYLGFWLDGHPKMDYKSGFRPAEALGPSGWRPLEVTGRS